MKGDFTRSTFRPERHYSSVRMQQGRVQLDADWNEHVDIQRHFDETTRFDVIGGSGVPKDTGGFEVGIAPDGADLTLSPGRIYVGGILCELGAKVVRIIKVTAATITLAELLVDGRELAPHEWIEIVDLAAGAEASGHLVRVTVVDAEGRKLTIDPPLDPTVAGDLGGAGARPAVRRAMSYTTQPDLPAPALAAQPDPASPPDLALQDGTYLAFLDVWQRHVTALDDGGIRETALGGPDTATRTKVVWQLQLAFLGEDPVKDCQAVPGWDDLLVGDGHRAPSTGMMRARARPEASPSDLCVLPPQAGYRRLENQLYRVEVHRSGGLGTATFKWSRDNGSVVTQWIGQDGNRLTVADTGRDAVLGFASGQLVELVDDTRELQREPGRLVTLTAPPTEDILTIDPGTAVDRSDFPGNPKVRRWDSSGEADVEVPATNDGWIALEEGVEVRFEKGHYNTGDYWLIPARTATGDVEWPRDGLDRPLARPPDGVAHHYCKLALVEVRDGVPVGVVDCRETFPTLAGACADDICFDNSACQLVEADTVQDALEILCEEHTLRHHKKHLHGWGIVCGLRTVCGPDEEDGPRAHVTVRSGYAIDADGNDLLLKEDESLDVLRMIEEREREEDRPLLENGNGEVCLALGLDSELRRRITVERYEPEPDGMASVLAGTLLGRFWTECVLPIRNFVRDELTPKKGEQDGVGPGRERQAILASLLAEIVNPRPGRSIYLSSREHEIMLGFYNRLRALLQSETFCAMFDNARSFPEYPPSMPRMDTIFGVGNHVRLRLRPGTVAEAYTVGPSLNPATPSTWINRYNLQERRLVARIDPIAGAEAGETKISTGSGAVEDVAFSPDGKRIFMVAPTRRGENTFFRAGVIGEDEVRWGPLTTICGVRLVTLATTAADTKHVYAVGRGKGLYRIDPDAVDPNMEPVQQFAASGHLEITPTGRAFATVATGVNPPAYDRLLVSPAVHVSVPQFSPINLPDRGVDGIALSLGARGSRTDAIWCVVGMDGSGSKRVLGFSLTGTPLVDPANRPVSIPVDDTSISMVAFAPTGALLLTYEDGYCARMIDLSQNRLVDGYVLPLQVGPISVGAGPEYAYVLNHVSDTITAAPAEVLDPSFRFPLADLAAYRKGILEALADLLAGFAQYLKDCLCDQFLVDCPESAGDERLYLACVSVRDGQVYQVCNFSRRRYVKSFPTVGYWLSLVPIMPILSRLLAQFCCLVFPELSVRSEAPEYEEAEAGTADARVSARAVRRGIGVTQATDPGAWLRELTGRLSTVGSVAVNALAQEPLGAPPPFEVGVAEIVGRPVDEVEDLLADRGVETRRVPYEATLAPGLGAALGGFLRMPRPGSEVVLHEEEGRVRFYSVAGAAPRALEARLRSLTRSLDEKDAEIGRLQAHMEDLEQRQAEVPEPATASRVSEMEVEIRALREQMEDLTRKAKLPRRKRGKDRGG